MDKRYLLAKWQVQWVLYKQCQILFGNYQAFEPKLRVKTRFGKTGKFKSQNDFNEWIFSANHINIVE